MARIESREERNRRIALEALDLLGRAAQGELTGSVLAAEVHALHARWEAQGVRWTRPRQFVLEPDAWLPAAWLADELDVDAATIRRWALRGHISSRQSDEGLLFNVGEIVAYRARRARRAAGSGGMSG